MKYELKQLDLFQEYQRVVIYLFRMMRSQVLKSIEKDDKKIEEIEKDITKLQSKLINQSVLKISKSLLPPEYEKYKKETSKPNPPPLSLEFLKNPKINPADVQRVIDAKEKEKAVLQRNIQALQNMINKQIDRQKVEEKILDERQKHLTQYLQHKKNLKRVFSEKDKYLIIQYEKDMMAYKKCIEAFQAAKKEHQKEKKALNEKIDEREKRIEGLMENLGTLRKEVKEAWDKIQVQERAIIDLNQLNSSYKAENTEVKLRNKNLSADNKVVLTHLDKLLKQKNEDQARTAKSVFEERQIRVIKALYSKNYATPIKNPEEAELLPSYRNQLSNKIKFEQSEAQFKKYRAEKEHTLQNLEHLLQEKESEIIAQAKLIAKLKDNRDNLQQINQKNKNSYQKSLVTIRRLEEKIQILEEQIRYLRNEQELRSKYYSNDHLFKFKTGIGSIVSKSNTKLDTTYAQTH